MSCITIRYQKNMLSKARVSKSITTSSGAISIVQQSVGKQHISTLLQKPNPLPQPQNTILETNQLTQLTQRSSSSSLFYNLLFSQLNSPPNLLEARKLHSLLIAGGFFHPSCTDRVLGSQLVNIYVKFGCLHEAFIIFNTLPNKNNIAWNALLRGLVDMGQFSEAIELFHLMLIQGLSPDAYTYPLVLKACSWLCNLEEGRRVLQLIQFNEIYYNVKHNIYVECACIDMFAKCGSLREARHVFEQMPRKDLASWTAIISGTVRNGEWIEALCLFRRMRLVGVRPDSVIVSAILPSCGRMEARLIGMSLQGCALISGFASDLYVSNALIDMYCKSGDTHEAHSVFCEIECKDEVSWCTLISGYSQNFHYRESIETYLRMKSFGIRTNAVTAASILPGLGKLKLLKLGKEMHSYILKQGFESDNVLGSALIDMYANCGSKREAEHIFEIMSDSSIMIWNSMIAGCILNGDVDSAFEIFRRMWESRVKPNHITLVGILSVCTRMGNLRQGKEIHGYTTRSSLGTVVSVGNSLIDMYCKCGYLELGVKVFEQMTEKNIVTYNTIISAHGIHGLGDQAFSFFDQMHKARIRPNKITFVALLSACSHAGLVDRGWSLYNSMINDYGIQPDMEHYSCMVNLLGRAGNLMDAFHFIRRMPVEPDMDVLGSLLGACQVRNMVELAELVVKHIFRKHLNDPGYYVLMSNIYASTKRWGDFLKVRTMIKDKGLIKKPGSSWIQVGCCIYMFHAGGQMHPEFVKIQEVLESLLSEMKGERYFPDPIFFSHDLVGDGHEVFNFDGN